LRVEQQSPRPTTKNIAFYSPPSCGP
jgi:hypothetical protein